MSLPFAIEGHELQTGTSVGIALSYSGSETAESLLREADAAMYRAKSSGRDVMRFSIRSCNTQAVTQLQIEADLRQALQNDEFKLVYQPIMDIRENRVAGFEAFVRWHHPTRGILLPTDFIPVAEQTGLILRSAGGCWARPRGRCIDGRPSLPTTSMT
jgi:predicted signal transduction protein with EAL and GGDEF domain